MKIYEQLSLLAAQGKYKTAPILFESALYYYGAILLNIANVQKIPLIGRRREINYYGLSFAGSGAGKDFAFSTVSKSIDINTKQYREDMKSALGCNMGLGTAHHDSKDIEDMSNALPLSYILGLDGTREGIFSAGRAQSTANYGAMNLTSSEFGDIINNSSELLGALKEFYDGEYKAKMIKSANVGHIKNITVNLMAFGSHAGLDSQARAEFNKLASSGMYRRSFIVDVKPSIVDRHTISTDISPFTEHIQKLRDKVLNIESKQREKIGAAPWFIEFGSTKDASAELDNVVDILLDRANADIHDDIMAAERGAGEMIENLAYIIAFLEGRTEIDKSDVLNSFDFYDRCRDTTKDTFKSRHDFEIMYEMIEREPGITASEMMAKTKDIPQNKTSFLAQMSIVSEMSLINGLKLNITGNSVERYFIEELPVNDNKKIIVAVSTDGKEFPVDFSPMEIPFFGKGTQSIEELVKDEDGVAFCTTHFEPSTTAKHGHRKIDNLIQGQNMIAFDIDDGMDLAVALNLIKPYTYIVYTTKSHQKDKGGKICDRFRILMPTKSTFYVTNDQHKEMYTSLAAMIGMDVFDTSTRDASRFWYGNKNADVYVNIGDNIDVLAHIPETLASKKFIDNIDGLDDLTASDPLIKASLDGIYKWFLTHTAKGDRNDHTFRFGSYIRDLGIDPVYHMEIANSKLDDPLSDKELKILIGSVTK